jgi:hypothetical protein
MNATRRRSSQTVLTILAALVGIALAVAVGLAIAPGA